MRPRGAAEETLETLFGVGEPPEASDPRVLTVLRSNFLLPPSSLPYNLSMHLDAPIYFASRSYGWEFYDHYIKHFFRDQRGGFFVEAGAGDGEFLSNTLWLETELGWSGLLLEVDPVSYRHLAWKQRRAWISNTCLSRERHPRGAVFETLSKEMEFRIWHSAAPWVYHSNTREVDAHPTLPSDDLNKSSMRAYSRGLCFPLASYLTVLNATVIDLLSLDIKGQEWAVLRNLPLAEWRVRSLAVEHLGPQEFTHEGLSTDEAFVTYMQVAGYRLVDVHEGINYFFVLSSDDALRRLSDPLVLTKFFSLNSKSTY